MIDREAIRRVSSPDFVGTVEVEVADETNRVEVRIGTRGQLLGVRVLRLDHSLKSEAGLRDALLGAAARAETHRTLQELALCGALDNVSEADAHEPLAPLPGPTAPPLVIRSPREQADAFARYVNSGALAQLDSIPGLTWSTSDNTYVSLGLDQRGRLQDVRADDLWLSAVTEDRLQNSLTQAVTNP
ncbi:MAG: hypothetical protein V9G04_03040 [Nocardioides sp.]